MLIYYFILFWILACIASFLMVIGQRTSRGESFVKGRSRCDNCHKSIPVFALLPIIGYLLTKGRCKFCRQPIHWSYPIGEIIYSLGILLILQLDFYQTQWIHMILFSILFIMAAADHSTYTVPNRFQFILFITILSYYVIFSNWDSFYQVLFTSLILGVLLLGLASLTDNGIGGADVKVFMIVALFFNWDDTFLLILLSCMNALFYFIWQRFIMKNYSLTGVALLPHIMVAYPIFLFFIST